MGEMITKPDAAPVLYALLNVFVCGLPVGTAIMGQSKKAMVGFGYYVLLSLVTCGFMSLPVTLVLAYDAYLLGQRLASGESIGELENGLDFLNSLPGFN